MKLQISKKWTIFIGIILSVCLVGVGYAIGLYTANQLEQGQVVLSDEGLPIMSAENRMLYEKYIKQMSVTGIFSINFSPEDVSALLAHGGNSLLAIVEAIENEEMNTYTPTNKVPATFVDEVLTKRFPLTSEIIRSTCEDIYDKESDSYNYLGGLGGGPYIPIVTGSKTNEQFITVYYTWYGPDPSADEFCYMADRKGELLVDISSDNFKYISNKIK